MAPPKAIQEYPITYSLNYILSYVYMFCYLFPHEPIRSSILQLARILLSGVSCPSIVKLFLTVFSFYMMRMNEVLLGSYRYASTLYTVFLFGFPIKFIFHTYGRKNAGPIFALSAITILHNRIIPTVQYNSFLVWEPYAISRKVVSVFILLCLTLIGGKYAFYEMVLGIAASFFLCPSFQNPEPKLSVPASFISFFTSFWCHRDLSNSSQHENVEVSAIHLQPAPHVADLPENNSPPSEQAYFSQHGNYEEDVVVDEELVEQLMAMGFERETCVAALRDTLNDISAAANHLLG